MKILVTGASGFVGRALLDHLKLNGHEVLCAGRVDQKSRILTSFVAVGNINGETDWSPAWRGVDVVVHLAGRAHIAKEFAKDPLQAFREVNVKGTLNLARQAIGAKVRRFVFISSIGVLGGHSKQPFCETDAPAPIEPYAISKWEAERGLSELLCFSETELVIIRPPLVYGPGAPGNFGRLVRAIQAGKILPFGAVDNRRTLVALGNLVDLIGCCISHPNAAQELFLAGDAEDLSTTELLQRLANALDRPSRLLPIPVWLMESIAGALGRKATIQKLCGNLQVDIGKARRLLGWIPPLSVDEGLRRVAEAAP